MAQPLRGREQIAQSYQLLKDFTDGQVACHAVKAAGAEDTAHAAAHLRADTGRVPPVFLKENTFDQLLIVETEEELVRAVSGLKMAGYGRAERQEFQG